MLQINKKIAAPQWEDDVEIEFYREVSNGLWLEDSTDTLVNYYAEQDAQEFLRYLLEGLHKDVNRITERYELIFTEVDEKLSDHEKAQESWSRYLRIENSIFVENFVGQLKSTLRCSYCGHCSMESAAFFDQISENLRSDIPQHLVNLLIVTGYGTAATLKNITKSDIKAIEKFAREKLPTLVAKEERGNFYGPLYCQKPEHFVLVDGFVNLILLMRDSLRPKSEFFKDASTMTEKVMELCEGTHSIGIHHSTSTLGCSSDGEVDAGVNGSSNSNSLIAENANVARIVRTWAKNRVGSEEWTAKHIHFNNVFNNIKYETAYHNTSENDGLICKVTCCCKNFFNVRQFSKKSTTKPRWVLSNFYSHLQQKHFTDQDKLPNTWNKDGVEKNKKKTGEVMKENKTQTKITAFTTVETTVIPEVIPPDPLLDTENVSLSSPDIVDKTEVNNKPKILQCLMFDNFKMTKRHTTVGDKENVLNISSFTPQQSSDLKISNVPTKNITNVPSADYSQNINRITDNTGFTSPVRPNVPLIDWPDQEHETSAETSSMVSSTGDEAGLHQILNSIAGDTCLASPTLRDVDWSYQEHEKFAENSCTTRSQEDSTHLPKQTLEQYPENIDFARSLVKMVPERALEIDHSHSHFENHQSLARNSSVTEIISEKIDQNDTCPTTKQRSIKWRSIKYSRLERERRRREASVSSEQTEITKFFPIIDKISETLSGNPNSLSFHNDPTASTNASDTETKNANLSKFLQDILEHALRNSDPKKKNSFESNLKQFGIYIYYIGGRQLYETLHANLHNVLPCIRTLQKFTFQQRIGYEPGKLNMRQLNTFLEKRNLKKVIWVSEDCTRLTSTIEYDSTTNSIFGFSSPLENGLPIPHAFQATSSEKIQSMYRNSSKADYALIIVAQALENEAPPFCLSVYGTDNKFNARDVSLRWKSIKEEAVSYGIRVLGISSDGDPRLLKAMKVEAGFIKDSTSWTHLDYSHTDTCYLQDSIHIIVKLKNKFLDHKTNLILGKYTAKVDDLSELIKNFSKDKHLLTSSNISNEDRMNYENARRICDQRVTDLLSNVQNTNGTKTFLKIMNYLNSAFVEKSCDLEEIVYKTFFSIFFLRIWRHSVKLNQDLKLQQNFITLNAYTCIELNGAMLIKLIHLFQTDNSLYQQMFRLWLMNSQDCETTFRHTRSMAPTETTAINFTLKQLTHKLERIQYLNNLKHDLKDTYVFPRETRKQLLQEKYGTLNVSNIDTDGILKKCLEDAISEAESLEMPVDVNAVYTLDINIERPADMMTSQDFEHVLIRQYPKRKKNIPDGPPCILLHPTFFRLAPKISNDGPISWYVDGVNL
ncbi:unnamed protein product [Phaedon cochleariae]|uniref:Peptidase C19 ubiquitin carboxyl-terminal hydrolase domain-containing protein n=1 Tax=Phaedon cochleariae TaxID=80249 RepID=A0A9N9SLR1_PHACE|nr:unnamed protein product [Phaedon cochleariae]